jgi:hypothetical protein
VIFLAWYLGFGAVILILIALTHHMFRNKSTDSPSESLVSQYPERVKPWDRIIHRVIGPSLIGLLVVPFWPAIVFFKVKQIIYGESETSSLDEPEFAVARDALIMQMTIPEIEQREMVSDPMRAVPNLPFGHLNAAWKRFLEGVKPDDSLWTFAAHWTQWGRKELRQGYVVVRGEVVGQHFLTKWKDIEEYPKTVHRMGVEKLSAYITGWLRKQAD